ncbi:ABC transporter ATP-binding protein [Sedimentibacter hydroxybenzoicus DSM 7310]|uniref:ABC transporter ATP-binding protein n=1 Tax=Sedimentibacter hydroxybenzoicus DSM 7310 TaxID=1123245 RepID=A0A974BGI2_SEDHY|nr:ABC transporter ATP-binding protein [Sedimentibacter hydroxybenzoicus]NYB72719.1 ABC transporter ATP-binding protein [Sedimentibacter hydroxybenzoicus DSM 7310]
MYDKLLEINNLHVNYKTADDVVYAVNGLNLSVRKGETLGLVGETGSGKTTVALSILKLLPEKIGFISNGRIWFESVDITKTSEKEMRRVRGEQISMIFQDPMTSLNPTIRVGEQIAENLLLHKKDMTKKQISDRVDEILRLVGLTKEKKNDFPHQLSGGMKQRVVIALALACEPKLLLADEPTTALDVTIQAQVLSMMHKLKEKLDTSMILITHDLGVVANNCDRVAIMYAGQIIEEGNIRDIFTAKHHHPYTLGLFGSIPDMSKKTRRLAPIDGMMPDPTNLPDGCHFWPRCTDRMDVCKMCEPNPCYKDTHMIKCHLYKDLYNERGKDYIVGKDE